MNTWDDLPEQTKLERIATAIRTQRPIGWRAALWLVDQSGLAPDWVADVKAGLG